MKIADFIKEAEKLNIILTNKQLAQFDSYAKELIEYNKHTNLTAITNLEDVYLKHFYDSMTIAKIIDLSNIKNLLDIGSGAGFPGLVIAILYPNIQITLLDSNNKKIKFLDYIISKLDLKNVNTIHERAEDFSHKNKEKFDVVTSRAVAQLRILLELSSQCIKIGGVFIAMKADVLEEQKESITAIKILNFKELNQIQFELPYSAGLRNLIKYEKIATVDSKYPRGYDQIKKKPLK